MAIKSIKIGDSDAAQRRAFASTFLNLDLTGAESDGEVLAKINQAQPGSSMIFVHEEEKALQDPNAEMEVVLRPEEASGKQAGSLGRGDPRATIFIPAVETDDKTGQSDVFVGVNGRGWQLKRGVDLDVPWRVVEALELAVQDVVRHSQEEGHEGEVIVTPTKRFPVQILKRPSPEEIADWHKRTDAAFCP